MIPSYGIAAAEWVAAFLRLSVARFDVAARVNLAYMNSDLLMVVSLLGAAIVMFALNRPRVDAVALIMMVLLPFTGVVSMDEALAGFANSSIVLIAAMFVLGEGLARTGIAKRLGDWLVLKGGSGELRLLATLMLTVGTLGALMSSTGVVAIFIPVVLRIAARTGVQARMLMMPMAFAGLVSGMMTLVATSPNLVVNQELIRLGTDGFGFFAFTPFGVPVLLLGIAYMAVARRWLREKIDPDKTVRARPRMADWIEKYELAGREHKVRIRPNSPLVGRTLGSLKIEEVAPGTLVIAIERNERFYKDVLRPRPKTELRAYDVLLLDAVPDTHDVDAICEQFGLDLMPISSPYFADQSHEVGMVEVMIPTDSRFAGKTIAEVRLRDRYELSVVGLKCSAKRKPEQRLSEQVLKTGDTLLLVGPWKTLRTLQDENSDLLLLHLPAEFDEVLPAAKRAPLALVSFGLAVGLMVTGALPNVQAALIGCLLMGLFKCIDLEKAYRAIQWKTVIMIVGMMPFALALERTGGVDLAAQALVGAVGNAGPHAILASLFAITVVMGLFVVNTANAVLMAPVALAVAKSLEASPFPFAMIVALAASAAFMTPVSPVNILVITAGGYRFIDFVKIGLPFTLIAMVVSVLLVPIFMPF